MGSIKITTNYLNTSVTFRQEVSRSTHKHKDLNRRCLQN